MTAASRPGQRPFQFGDLRRQPEPDNSGAIAEAAQRAARESGERDGYARGFEDGRMAAQAEIQARIAETLQRVADSAAMAVALIDGRVAATEAEALLYFHDAALKLAGDLAAAQPLMEIAEAAREAFQHLRGVSHLVVRVAPVCVEETDTLLRQMARDRGFEGRIIVIGDDEMAPGDARLEWADGGVARDRKSLEAAASAAIALFLTPLGAPVTGQV